MIKYTYPDGTHCYRAIHTVHAVFRDDEGKLVTRVYKPGGGFKIFEIKGFEIIKPEVFCD